MPKKNVQKQPELQLPLPIPETKPEEKKKDSGGTVIHIQISGD